jgi:hypothetical protein
MTFLSQEHILAWIRDESSSTWVAGLQHVGQGVVEVEAIWSEFPRLLRDASADVRWVTAALLVKAARDKDIGAFVPDLEDLIDDPTVAAFACGCGLLCAPAAATRSPASVTEILRMRTIGAAATIGRTKMSAVSRWASVLISWSGGPCARWIWTLIVH